MTATTIKKKNATKKRATKAKPTKATRKADVKKVSQIEAAIKVLAKAGGPMNCTEMVEAMTKRKLWASPGGATPEATLYSSILRDIKTNKKNARFKKVARGQFALAPQK